MLMETVQGERRSGPNVQSDGRSGPYSELIVNDAGYGRYFEATRLGRLFVAANPAAAALSIAGNLTATGLILSNPAGSGKLLVIEEIIVANTVAIGAVGGVGVFANVNPLAAATVHTTPVTVRPTILGSAAASVALADSAATLPATAALVRPLYGVSWVTTGATAEMIATKDELGGTLAVAPGCTLSIGAITTAYTVMSSITFAEVDWPL